MADPFPLLFRQDLVPQLRVATNHSIELVTRAWNIFSRTGPAVRSEMRRGLLEKKALEVLLKNAWSK